MKNKVRLITAVMLAISSQSVFAQDLRVRCSYVSADGPDITIESNQTGGVDLFQLTLGSDTEKNLIDSDPRGAVAVFDTGVFIGSTTVVNGLNTKAPTIENEFGVLPLSCESL